MSTLLPITDPLLAAAIIAELIPGTLIEPEVRTAAPSRSWIFAPIGWRYRWAGADTAAFIASQGWVERTTSLVPHHKTQSVELRQGPLQRRRGVATVEVHSPPGPVDADASHLDAAAARSMWEQQLDRTDEPEWCHLLAVKAWVTRRWCRPRPRGPGPTISRESSQPSGALTLGVP